MKSFPSERSFGLFGQHSMMCGLRSAQHAPERKLIVLGEAALLGALSGFLAIEVGPDGTTTGSKLWALYESALWSFTKHSDRRKMQQLPYARIDADAPLGTDVLDDLTYWIDPTDSLTCAAGLGSEWLIPVTAAPSCGLILAKINSLMLDAETVNILGLNYCCPNEHLASNC